MARDWTLGVILATEGGAAAKAQGRRPRGGVARGVAQGPPPLGFRVAATRGPSSREHFDPAQLRPRELRVAADARLAVVGPAPRARRTGVEHRPRPAEAITDPPRQAEHQDEKRPGDALP